jgi:hypothetical protein
MTSGTPGQGRQACIFLAAPSVSEVSVRSSELPAEVRVLRFGIKMTDAHWDAHSSPPRSVLSLLTKGALAGG